MSSANSYFRKQHGLITHKQAIGAGVTRHQIDRLAVTGEWERLRRGVYRHGAHPPTWESQLLAATMGRNGALASHRSAAALWNLELYRHPPPEITVPYGATGRRVHSTSQWELRGKTVRRGIPCTGIERTIIDCAAVVGIAALERLAESAIRQGLTSWERLRGTLDAHSKMGRNGCASLRALLDSRTPAPTVPLSDFSRRVANLLEGAGIEAPVVEHPISSPTGRHLLTVDLAWPDRKKAWELDGLEFHFGRREVEQDKRKRNAVKNEGWAVQEILWSMYRDSPEELVAMARLFLAA